MKRVIIATNNQNKAKEIETALAFPNWEFLTLADAGLTSDPEETSDTFLGNAKIKARAAKKLCDCAVLADDSGLEVDALNGEPGVYSSRYAGTHGNDAANNEKLLRELGDTPLEKRTARFVCTLVFIDDDNTEIDARGTIEGHIGFKAKGDSGFGYDPLFLPVGLNGKTFAEVPQAKKNEISHRGNALRTLRDELLKKGRA